MTMQTNEEVGNRFKYKIGTRVKGKSTSGKEVQGIVMGRDNRPLNHNFGDYLVVRDETSNTPVFVEVSNMEAEIVT